jgi:large subunit ribosomal protein L30e
MQMDLNKALRTATKTGKVLFGLAQAQRAIKDKKGKLIVIASNCPDESLKKQKILKVLEFPGTNRDLGAACGKPFSVSAVIILEPGDSQILAA